MKRYTTLCRLFCGLTLLPFSGAVAQARQAAPGDASPGWAIILADDYQGDASKINGVVQYDAMNWYRLLVTKLKFQPDHIILLAEGKPDSDFQKFLDSKLLPPNMEGQTPFTESPLWADYEANKEKNRVGRQLDRLKAQRPDMKEDINDFRDMFTLNGKVPLCDAPTAHKFRVARNIIAALAGKTQTVALIVSSHAGSDPGLTLTKPVGGAAASENSLSAEDFALKDCKAGHRLLALDNSLRYFDEAIDAPKSNKFGRAVKSAFSGNGSLALLASDGSSISWPMAYKGKTPDQPTIAGGAFSNAVISAFESQNDYDVKGGQEAVKRNFDYEMSRFKRAKYLGVKAVGYANPAPLIDAATDNVKITALFNPAPKVEVEKPADKVVTVSEKDITDSTTLDPTRPDLKLVQISKAPVGEFPSKRAAIIKNRFVTAIHSDLRVSDKSEIVVGTVGDPKHEQIVVRMPKRVNVVENGKSVRWFVTVDDEFARMMGKPKMELAEALARDIRLAMDKKYSGTLALKPTDQIQYVEGRGYFNSGKFGDAATAFASILKRSPDYGDAYVWLGRSYLRGNQPEKAQEMLEELQGIQEDHPEYRFDATTETALNSLRGELGMAQGEVRSAPQQTTGLTTK